MTHRYGETVAEFTPGQRVETHPATDAWMSGERFGTVEKLGTKSVHVRMDVSLALKRFHPTNLRHLDD